MNCSLFMVFRGYDFYVAYCYNMCYKYTVGVVMKNKLIELYKILSDGVPYFSSYLIELGYSYSLLQKYKKRGWLESPYKSVYIKPGSRISPLGIIYAFQNQKNMKIHIGGITALILKGISEQIYPTEEMKKFYILYSMRIFVPKWVKRFCKKNNMDLNFKQLDIFKLEIGLTSFNYNKMNINISSTERAVLEMLSLIRTRNDYFDALKYFELVGELRTNVVVELLNNCRSIKSKRLFLYLSERYDKEYFKKINKNSIILGNGPRRIINDGSKSVYIQKYDIEIPQEVIS